MADSEENKASTSNDSAERAIAELASLERVIELAPRARVRDLFLRALGLVYLGAFLSLLSQLRLLIGERGLLPAAQFLERARPFVSFAELPTVFWLGASDGALEAVAIAGAIASVALVLLLAPRIALAVVWVAYVSLASVGQDFLSFQWDTLLCESAFFAFLLAPRGLRPRGGDEPHAIAVLLALWLVFRLNVESGLAKALSSDGSWRSLAAMESYYETAPIPTPLAWWAHQLPPWAHRAESALTLAVELGVPPLVFATHRLRAVAFAVLVAFQAVVFATANYGFFNPLSAVLCLLALDDDHLAWIAARARVALAPRAERRARPIVTGVLLALAAIVVPLSIFPFLPVVGVRAAAPVRNALYPWHTLNAYHLFANMTFVRREAVIECSRDGVAWEPYEFKYKAGDPTRAPPFVAPHQPRVDFQMWFLLLGGRADDEYFQRLCRALLEDPESVAPLFARMPFGLEPPRAIRVIVHRYRFTDLDEGRRTGAWWKRDPLYRSNAIERR